MEILVAVEVATLLKNAIVEGKASGEDGITLEVLKRCSRVLRTVAKMAQFHTYFWGILIIC